MKLVQLWCKDPSDIRNWQQHPHDTGFVGMKDTILMGIMESSPVISENIQGQAMYDRVDSWQGNPNKLLSETFKVNSKFQW